MQLSKGDADKIRTITENIAPLTTASDPAFRHLATQLTQLCKVLTGDDIEIVDPKNTPRFDQDAAMARTAAATAAAASENLR